MAKGATVTAHATAHGDRATLRLPGSAWVVEPQVMMGGVQPDFLLTCADPEVPRVAVFCDSGRWHSSAQTNRVADDAGKRAALRDQDVLVWAVTHQDLDAFAGAPTSSWCSDVLRARFLPIAHRLAAPGSVRPDVLVRDPLSVMAEFLLRPDPAAWRSPARGVGHEGAAWRTYLHPTQRAVAHRETWNGPYRLAGGAGTGKTVVALHRAAFLARRPGARVLLCTFTRNLAADLEVDVRSLVGPDELSRITVRGADQMVRAVAAAVDGPPGPLLGSGEQETLWEDAVRAAGVPADLAPLLTPAFLAGEYRAVLSRFGIETRGRSRRLTLNYRTSRQNLAFALGVIDGEAVIDLDGADESVAGYHSTFAGPTPVTRGFPGIAEEMRFLVDRVRSWHDGVAAASIAVLARRSAEQDRARTALQEAGIAVELLQKEGVGNPDAVKIASMHRAKGTEFSRVVVVGAEAGVVPLDWVFEHQPASEASLLRGRERSLFYVACSRARDELIVTWSGAPSPFLPVG